MIWRWIREFFDPFRRARRIDKEVLFKAMVEESCNERSMWRHERTRMEAVSNMWRWHTRRGIVWEGHLAEAEEFLKEQGYK